jgi:putative spermidine/putrescine transport system permease protein
MKRYLPQTVLAVFLLLALLPLMSVGYLGFVNQRDGFTAAPVFDLLFNDPRALTAILNTLLLSVLTVLIGYALVIPSLMWMHLRAPKALAAAETASLLPYIIPAVALVGGVNLVLRPIAPGFFVNLFSLVPFYVLITLPFMFRTIDTGLRGLDLRTLMRASESLGSGTIATFFTVILPNLRSAIISGSLLVFMMASGELVMAQLLLHKTFPTFIVELGNTQVRLAAALSFLTIIGSWILMAILLFASRDKRTNAQAAQLTI